MQSYRAKSACITSQATVAAEIRPAAKVAGLHPPATSTAGPHPVTNTTGPHPATSTAGPHPATCIAGPHPATNTTGVTLVELLLVLALAGILLSAAAPAYQQMMERQRLRGAVADMVAAIDLTRSQALARGRVVLLVPLDPGGVDWRGGWTVFVDANGNRRPDSDETAIFQRGALPEGMRITVSFSSKAPPAYVAYNGAGRSCSAGNSLAARWGTLSLALGDNARNIKINMLGRLRVCDPAVEAACTGASD